MVAKILKWIIFSVVMALLPLFFIFLRMITRDLFFDLPSLVSHGELLLISAAISSAAVGEALGSGSNRKAAKIVSGGCCVVILALCSFYFADIFCAHISDEAIDNNVVFNTSAFLFLFSVLSGGSCLILGDD